MLGSEPVDISDVEASMMWSDSELSSGPKLS